MNTLNWFNHSNGIDVVVCADFSGKEPHEQLRMDRVIASEDLGDVMVSILAMEWEEVWVRIFLYALGMASR